MTNPYVAAVTTRTGLRSLFEPPRRAGTGERQAERRPYTGDQPHVDEPMILGQVISGDDPAVINEGADVVSLRVENTADRPVQVGLHCHFAETNRGVAARRLCCLGSAAQRLVGGSVRFEPGAVEDVVLILIRGQRIVAGLREECGGELDG